MRTRAELHTSRLTPSLLPRQPIVSALLVAKVDVNAPPGHDPVFCAVRLAPLLVNRADPSAADTLRALLADGPASHADFFHSNRDAAGASALHYAAAAGDAAAVGVLVAAGWDPLGADVFGLTPVDAAAEGAHAGALARLVAGLEPRHVAAALVRTRGGGRVDDENTLLALLVARATGGPVLYGLVDLALVAVQAEALLAAGATAGSGASGAGAGGAGGAGAGAGAVVGVGGGAALADVVAAAGADAVCYAVFRGRHFPPPSSAAVSALSLAVATAGILVPGERAADLLAEALFECADIDDARGFALLIARLPLEHGRAVLGAELARALAQRAAHGGAAGVVAVIEGACDIGVGEDGAGAFWDAVVGAFRGEGDQTREVLCFAAGRGAGAGAED